MREFSWLGLFCFLGLLWSGLSLANEASGQGGELYVCSDFEQPDITRDAFLVSYDPLSPAQNVHSQPGRNSSSGNQSDSVELLELADSEGKQWQPVSNDSQIISQAYRLRGSEVPSRCWSTVNSAVLENAGELVRRYETGLLQDEDVTALGLVSGKKLFYVDPFQASPSRGNCFRSQLIVMASMAVVATLVGGWAAGWEVLKYSAIIAGIEMSCLCPCLLGFILGRRSAGEMPFRPADSPPAYFP